LRGTQVKSRVTNNNQIPLRAVEYWILRVLGVEAFCC
jgi:hypothetical protein